MIVKENKLEKNKIGKLKYIAKCFSNARATTGNIALINYIKVEDSKIKLTDARFLLEIKNDFGLKEQYIEVDSFLKNGELNCKYEYIYPDFEAIKKFLKVKDEDLFKFEIDVNEFLKKVKINSIKLHKDAVVVFRIVNDNLFIYLKKKNYRSKRNRKNYIYKKLGIIKINNEKNVNNRFILDPLRIINIFKIFKKVKDRRVVIEIANFKIKDWKDKEKYNSWVFKPIILKTENCFGLIMQRIR